MSIIDITKKYLGSPYEFEANATQPGEKMDCSLLIQLIMREFGIYISRTITEQYKEAIVKELKMLDYILEIILSFMLHQLKEKLLKKILT